MREVQAAELRDDEEQEQHQGAPGVEEVLSLVPRARGAQGNSLTRLELSSSRVAGYLNTLPLGFSRLTR